MHPRRAQCADPLQRPAPSRDVGRLTGHLINQIGILVQHRRVRRVPDQHINAVHEDALVTDGVPRRGHDRQAGKDLRVPVEQLEPRVHEAEPLIQFRLLDLGPGQFRALHVDRGVAEHRVLPAVVEMQVGVHHQRDVRR
jgi:hypothetical protein